MKYILVFGLVVSFNSLANFQKLSHEFLQENASVKNILGNVIKANQAIKLVESTLTPGLDAGLSYLDNNSDAANAVNFAAGKTTSFELNFSKSTRTQSVV